jgi:hypothetical protein
MFSRAERLFNDFGQDLFVSPVIDFLADAHDGAFHQPRFLQHEFYQLPVVELALFPSRLFETRAAEIEHLRGRLARNQAGDFLFREFILEKVPVLDLDLLLREKLPRFTAGVSTGPAIELDFIVHGHHPSNFLWIATRLYYAGRPDQRR